MSIDFNSPIGIMGAMEEEVSSLKSAMDVSQIKVIGGREYVLGKLFGLDTVLVFSRWGKVAAAATVATLIVEFKVATLIFTGVAGATANHLNIGDVVIATHLYQHDMNAAPLFPKREIPYLSTTFFSVDPHLLQLAKKAAHSFFQDSSSQVYLGLIASGDEFVSDPQHIMREVPETLAVEMEGAAVAQVCYEYDIPFIVIRTISDRADHAAVIDFPKFVSEVATHYSLGIIKEMSSILC